MKKIVVILSLFCNVAHSMCVGYEQIEESNDIYDLIVQDVTKTKLESFLNSGEFLRICADYNTTINTYNEYVDGSKKNVPAAQTIDINSVGGKTIKAAYRSIALLLIRAAEKAENAFVSVENIIDYSMQRDPRVLSADMQMFFPEYSNNIVQIAGLGLHISPSVNNLFFSRGANPFMCIQSSDKQLEEMLFGAEEKVAILQYNPYTKPKVLKFFYMLNELDNQLEHGVVGQQDCILWKKKYLQLNCADESVKIAKKSTQAAHIITHFISKYPQQASPFCNYLYYHDLCNSIVDKYGHTPLHLAIKNRSSETVRRLVTPYNIMMRDVEKQSPVVYAITGCDLACLKTLVNSPWFDITKKISFLGKHYTTQELVDVLMETRKNNNDISVLNRCKRILRVRVFGYLLHRVKNFNDVLICLES